MKKQLTTLAVIGCMMTATAQAFVPLTNSQVNLGSFRSNATRGMFYTELDVFSASPVEIGDTEGNYIYTNWSNLRTGGNTNFTAGPGAGSYDAALGYNTIGAVGPGLTNTNRFLTLGLSGQPLWFLPVVGDIRAGAVYQNSGNKAGSFNLDGDIGGIIDQEWKYTGDIYTIANGTNTIQTRDVNRVSDLKYVTNTTNNQWDAGLAWKGFILKDFDLGASFSRRMTQNVRTTRGTRTYTDSLLDESAVGGLGLPAGTREIATYKATYADNTEADMNSASVTDALAQARIGFLPFFTAVSGGVGVRVQRNTNPGTGLTDEAGAAILVPFEKNSVDLNLRDQVTVSTAVAGPLNTTAYRLREGTNNRTGSGLDYGALEPIGAASYTGALISTSPTAGQRATVDYADVRNGAGPLARLEIAKKFEKVKISLVGDFSSVKQDVAATQKLRAYSKDVTPVLSTRNTTRVITDYTQNRTWTGKQTTNNLDGGAKFDFLAMDGVNLALGGFITQVNTVSEITSATYDTTELASYDDGDAATNSVGSTFNNIVRPSAGNGEGTWSQTMSRKASGKVDTTMTQISVPVGVEIPLSKKWTFRAGTRYVMQRTKSTATTKTLESKTVTVVSNANPGGLAGPTTTWTTQDSNPVETTVVNDPGTAATNAPAAVAGTSSPAETHFMEYSYGIQFDPTKSLSLAANAFLDTNANAGPLGGLSNASILDLNTYRLLAIQAVFKF